MDHRYDILESLFHQVIYYYRFCQIVKYPLVEFQINAQTEGTNHVGFWSITHFCF